MIFTITIPGEFVSLNEYLRLDKELKSTYHKKHSNGRDLTIDEKEKIIRCYLDNKGEKKRWLAELSQEIGRPRGGISRYARKLGLTSRKRIDTIHGERKRKDSEKSICMDCHSVFSHTPYEKRKYCSKECATKGTSKNRHYPVWKVHPRGMLGKTHSKEYRKELSVRMKKDWEDKSSVYNSEMFKQKRSDTMLKRMSIQIRNDNQYSRTTKGWRDYDNGKKYYLKSKWEMNYGYYLDFLLKQKEIRAWEYEPETFWFEEIKRGVRSYTPDFKVTDKVGNIEYHEVKGWMDGKSQTKLKRMKKYHPEIKMVLIDETQYKALKKQVSRLCNWE